MTQALECGLMSLKISKTEIQGGFFVKFFIKRDISADFGVFDIYDERGIEKYLAEFSKSKRSRKIIIHNASETFVNIRCFQLSNLIACNISTKSKKMRLILGVNHNDLVCVCSGVNWKICGNVAKKDFSILDVDNSVIASQKRAFSRRESYELTVYSSVNELLPISVAVCINMLNTVDNPIRQAV